MSEEKVQVEKCVRCFRAEFMIFKQNNGEFYALCAKCGNRRFIFTEVTK